MKNEVLKYAFVDVLNDFLDKQGCDCTVDKSPAFESSRRAFGQLSAQQQKDYRLAAQTAVNIIEPLEPRLMTPFTEETLFLIINDDAAGQGVGGDVRDIICSREGRTNTWQIGFSFKHEWDELRKVRMPLDFGLSWLGIHCSENFINTVKSILSPISKYTPKDAPNWNTFPDKFDRFYVPLLQAYIEEIERLCDKHENVPKKLASYFFGNNGYYTIVGNENARTTDVQVINVNGDLAQNTGKIKSKLKIKTIRLPTELYGIDFKRDRNKRESKTTITFNMNECWSFHMRLHTQKRKATVSSLAWDITIGGRPFGFYQTFGFWDTITERYKTL